MGDDEIDVLELLRPPRPTGNGWYARLVRWIQKDDWPLATRQLRRQAWFGAVILFVTGAVCTWGVARRVSAGEITSPEAGSYAVVILAIFVGGWLATLAGGPLVWRRRLPIHITRHHSSDQEDANA